MAIPTSGLLSIKSTAGLCRSICGAVGTASGSLSTLSVAAGKGAPHCMREFYGYSPPSGSISVSNPSTTNSSGSLHINSITASGPWAVQSISDTYGIITTYMATGTGSQKITAGTSLSSVSYSRSAIITYGIEPLGLPTATWTITIPAYA